MPGRSIGMHMKDSVDLAEPGFGVAGWSSQREGDLFGMPKPCRQSVWRILGDDASPADDDHSLAYRGSLGEYVRAQDDRMRSCQTLNQFPDLDDLLGVESDGRLVENEDGRVVDEG